MLNSFLFSQVPITSDIMTKKGKKKPKIVEYDSSTEMAEAALVKRVEIIYKDMKAITRADPNFK